LFNPREHRWDDHFKLVIEDEGADIVGISALGRATAHRLGFHLKKAREARLMWIFIALTASE
jgi:hypothetical protein